MMARQVFRSQKFHGLFVPVFCMFVLVFACKSVSSNEPAVPDITYPMHETRFFRVYFDDLETAHGIVIAMNAVESKYEKGFIIVETTSEEEYERLLATDLYIEEISDPLAATVTAMHQAAEYGPAAIPGFPCYRTVEETFATAESIVSDHPELATLIDSGDSWEKTHGFGGYDMNILVLTNSAIMESKPKLFITSAIHAREYATAELVTRFAEYLVDNYGTDADATWLLDYHELHVMLHTNPDGRKKAESGLSWRKNTNQDYCSPTSNSRGSDLNRNFDFKWGCCGGSSGGECDSMYRGAAPGSEPEVQAVQNYLRTQFPDQRGPDDTDGAPLDATGIYIDVHASGRLMLWPWSWTSSPTSNGVELQTIGRKLAYFDGHTPKQAYAMYPMDGTTIGSAYGEMGIASFLIELGTAFFEDCSYFETTILPGNRNTLLYALKIVRTPYMTANGPDSVGLSLDVGSKPGGVHSGTMVTLTATIDDTRYSTRNGTEPSQNIIAAEYYVDVPPWIASPPPVAVAMIASDTVFDTETETVEAVIDTTGFSEGRHIIFVRGQDADSNWGAFSAIFLYIRDTVEFNSWLIVCSCILLLSILLILRITQGV